MEWKKDLYSKVREAAEKFSSIYVLRFDGMRIQGLNQIRKHFRDSVIFLGKNKVMALALGKDEASEVGVNVSKIATRLEGQCGLLFTDRMESEVVDYFDALVETDYARSGGKATKNVVLEEGPLPQFSHAIEPHLRSLGMPTQLKRGAVTLVQEYTVCKKKQQLTPNQASILKLLEIPMAEFRVQVDSRWTKPDDFKVLFTNRANDSGVGDSSDNEVDDDEEGKDAEDDAQMELTSDESD